MRIEKILLVDDDDELRRWLTELLSSQGFTVLGVSSILQTEEAIKSDHFDLILADLVLANHSSGLDLLKKVRRDYPKMPAILMTGHASMETAVEAVRIGLFDYLIKPFSAAQLDFTLKRLESYQQLALEHSYLRQELESNAGPAVIWGRSPIMQEIYELVQKVGQTPATVLIQGESGSGKELIAHAIRQNSPRAQEPFVKVNCAAVPETLLESEFFGHEKGAFTGAVQRREGRFEAAHGGTLLLDEIAEIPMSLQVKLLRVLQEREFERVGGNRTIKTDVRIIASTNRDLFNEVKEGRFREDLFYRLNVVPINVPPLRLRGKDLDDLAHYFLNQFARKHGKELSGFTDGAWEKMRGYRWPGNVRELQNVLERAVIMAPPGKLLDLPVLNLETRPAQEGFFFDPASPPTMENMERKLIGNMLIHTRNNKTHAAKKLAISLRTLRNKLQLYRKEGLDTERPDQWA